MLVRLLTVVALLNAFWSGPPATAGTPDEESPGPGVALRRPGLTGFYLVTSLAVGGGIAAAVYNNQGSDYYRQYRQQITIAGAKDYWERTSDADRLRNLSLAVTGVSLASAMYLRIRYDHAMRQYKAHRQESPAHGELLPVQRPEGYGVASERRF